MAKFYGKVGYTVPVEGEHGVTKDLVVEIPYYGEVLRNTRKLESGEYANNDISVSNSISIVADPYATTHIFAMRYVEWQGSRWVVDDVEVRSPRLILRLGGVYNGPKPQASTASTA